MKWMPPALLMIFCAIASAEEPGSACFGTVSNGRLENGVQLPSSGSNFSAYSSLGVFLGRNYVHSTVRDITLDAYAATAKALPRKVFVYGETGWASGGRIRPHKTHRNGTSIDFFVPVLDADGHSVPLPIGVTNKFGYDIEFDEQARYEDLSIDFEAIGEHLFQLQAAAVKHGAPIKLVIFDPRYMPKLFQTIHGEQLKVSLNFMQHDAWVRHDEHYHVDFGVKCAPLVP